MKKSNVKSSMSFLRPALLGAGISILFGIIIIAIGALLISNGKMPLGKNVFVIGIMQCACIAIGSLAAGKMEKGNKILTTAVSALITYFLLACVTILAFEGRFHNILTGIAAGAIGWGIAMLLLGRKGKTGKLKHKKFKYR